MQNKMISMCVAAIYLSQKQSPLCLFWKKAWIKIAGKPKVKSTAVSNTGFSVLGDFSHSPGKVCFSNSLVKGFTAIDKHKMNFPEKFLKWGKVHGSKSWVCNEMRP